MGITPSDDKGVRDALERLTVEFAATQRLQEISVQTSRDGALDELYEQVVAAAVVIMESHFASMQMLDPERGNAPGELRLLAFRGFDAAATRFWEWVGLESSSSCGMAFRTRQRCIVTDVEQCDFMAGTADLATYRDTGIRAVQTTPLLSRDGELVGMISTHWRAPHTPTERDLRLFDLLARQAADLIEFGKSREQLRTLVTALREADQRKDELLKTLSHELRNPLAPLRNALYVLRSRKGTDAATSHAHAMMERQVDHLVRLVDDLLELSRVSRGTLQWRTEPPLSAEARAESVAEAAERTTIAQQRILIVDDNQDAADSLGSLLAMLGADVRIAHSGLEALEIVEPFNPQVVLLDIGMPDMDGYEVARRIRSGRGDRQPTIVALSGWGQPEDRRRSREAGFDHHLLKPADIGVLGTLLRSLHEAPPSRDKA